MKAALSAAQADIRAADEKMQQFEDLNEALVGTRPEPPVAAGPPW